MRWFNKRMPRELWDEVGQGPIDDLEAVRLIRNICNSAVGSAEKVGEQLGGAATKANRHQTERYQRAAKATMEIAMKISDDLLRDSAVDQIVGLCVEANDLRTATILFRAIQAVSIKEDILNKHPVLRKAVG
jgi:hypothetical protein